MCLVYAINIAARYVVTTVFEPIRLELALTDAGAAFLTGVPLALFYVVFMVSLLAFTFFGWLLGQVSAGKVASHAFVNPLVEVALGAWMLGEPITRAMIGGMALILVSVFCILRFGRE
jgi:drug/metabolite transporter (DMT)-like permease